jgi:hypothetical protein
LYGCNIAANYVDDHGAGQSMHVQDIFGVFYNLVKYTAPAFIFGILYTTIRTNDEKGSFSYAKHMRANWSNLFCRLFGGH